MAGLKDTTIASGYKSLLRVDDNSGVGNSVLQITDGDGNATCLLVSEDLLQIRGKDTDGNVLFVEAVDGTDLLKVNSSVPYVEALGHYVNTQYAHFGVTNTDSASFADDTHQAIPFGGSNGMGNASYPPEFGTSTEPETTFTTADANNHRASDLVPCLWFVPDNITIDDVYAFVGSDVATADTATRIHLFQYTFNSGSTSALTSGSVIAHSTADTNNAGSEQAYKTTLSKDVTDIDAGKVILAFFRSDSINGDFSINITVKYYLR